MRDVTQQLGRDTILPGRLTIQCIVLEHTKWLHLEWLTIGDPVVIISYNQRLGLCKTRKKQKHQPCK